MKKTIKEFEKILNEVSEMIESNSSDIEYSNLGNAIDKILTKKATIQDIVCLIESVSMAEEFISATKEDELIIMDYDELLDYLSHKDKEEQKEIVRVLREHISYYFIWETNHYHCVTKLVVREHNQNNKGVA